MNAASLLNLYFRLPANSGAGRVEWSLRTDLPGGVCAVLAAVLAVALVMLLGWLYARQTVRLSLARRAVLMGLRTCSVLALIVMALQVRLTATHSGTPMTVVLLDASASMGLRDESPDGERPQLPSDSRSAAGATRLDLVKAAFGQNDSAVWREWLRASRLELFRFDATSERLLASVGPGDAQVIQSRLQSLLPDGEQTRIGKSVEQVLDVHRGSPPAALVLVTDGNATDALLDDLIRAAERASRQGTRLIAVGVGREGAPADLTIQQVRFDAVNFAQTRIPIDVDVAGINVPPEPQRVSIRPRGESALVDSVEVRLSEGPHRSATAQLAIPGLSSGPYEFEIAIEPAAGEIDLDNNSRQIRVYVRETPLRVLYVEQVPRWEYRHLKNALERDHDVDLSTLLLDADPAVALEDRTSIERLPPAVELFNDYDVVILGDVAWDRLPEEFLGSLPEFVSRRGGGLIFIPGPHNDWAAAPPDAIAELVPADVSPINGPAKSLTALRAVPTIEGRGHPILEIDDLPATRMNWDQLPPVLAPELQVSLLPGGTVLLEGTTVDPSPRQQPLLVSQRYGAGEVLFQLFDDSWRWRSTRDGVAYRRYWSQSLRFAAKRRIVEEWPKLELIAERDRYVTGQTVTIRLAVNDPTILNGLTPEMLVTGGGRAQTVQMTPTESDQTRFEAELSELDPGEFVATISSPELSRLVPPVHWLVEPFDAERSYRPQNRTALEEAARASGGKYVPLTRLDQVIDELPRESRSSRLELWDIPLWRRPEAIGLVAGLLIAEWILRRRAGLV